MFTGVEDSSDIKIVSSSHECQAPLDITLLVKNLEYVMGDKIIFLLLYECGGGYLCTSASLQPASSQSCVAPPH